MLGVTFFATAMLAYILAKRLRETEQLAAQRGVDLANLAQLNEHVIQRMQSGILVIDSKGRIRLSNNSAWVMLDVVAMRENQSLESVSPQLSAQLVLWKNDHLNIEPQVFKPSATSTDILPRFMNLGIEKKSGTLIFLEDTSVMAQQAQQLKMASLGRLTASIAHEVRNPLGAISHAGQLLAESPKLDKSDLRLTEIIRNHSDRVNKIVENVLQLSRSDKSKPQRLVLKQWLTDFADEFRRDNRINPEELAVKVTQKDLKISMDPSQLHQVLWNLCQNGIRHSASQLQMPRVELIGNISKDMQTPYIDIIDHGPGIDTETALNIFEPFFTTESAGTGLGLFIARELCEANNARLTYIPMPREGTCFRINFSHMNLSG
jgi:two-component system sensor histidine kinase PilS (NtrC family)